MDPAPLARALAVSRVAYGAGMALAPGAAAAVWVGRGARDPRTQVLARALGARDLVLGAGGLVALQRGDRQAARPWFAAQVLTDSVDCVATLLGGRALPVGARLGTATLAAVSAGIAAAYAARG
jgi:hypothetical protein